MTQRSKTERTIRYATTVDHLHDAWAFVMDHLDQVGGEPRIVISPIVTSSWGGSNDLDSTRGFEVMVEGMIEE